MTRHDPDRPSIFAKPDADVAREPTRTPVQPPYGENPTVVTSVTPAPRPPRPPRPPQPAYVPEPPDDRRGPISRQVIVLGSMGIAIMALGGFIGASILRPASDPAAAVASAEPSSSAVTVVPSEAPSVEPTTSAEPTVEPTPQPTPVGPPKDVAVGGWATVTVGELNVRRSAGVDAETVYRLVQGAVVHVPEGPAVLDGTHWYRVASLGGANGWASSGSVGEPYLETLVNDPTLIRCGKVMRPVFEIVDGAPRPHDPLLIGSMALPVAAFSDASLGALELLRGMDQEACFSAQAAADGRPTVGSELNVGACGHAVAEGGFFRLRPVAGGSAPLSSQVKDPVVLHPSMLAGGPPDERMSSNIRSIVTMMANEGVSGCFYASVVTGTAGVVGYRSVDVTQCSVVHEYNADSLKLTPAAGGELAWIKLNSPDYEPGRFPLETPVMVSVTAHAGDQGQSVYAWRGDACG